MSRASIARTGRSLAAVALLVALPLAVAAAAAPHKKGDPLEKLNRATFAFNDALDRMLARPAARAWVKVVPAPVRKAFSNFVFNINYPEVIVNDALQGKFKDAGSDLVRLLINTTIGIGGLADPATRLGFQSHDEDFGQTLGHWGVPAGPYIVIPVLGPSDLRDGPGKAVDTYLTPYHYLKSSTLKYGIYAATLLDKRVGLLSTDDALRNAYDPYAFVRNAYVARRQYLVLDGNVPEETFDDDPVGGNAPGVPALPALGTGGDSAAGTTAVATAEQPAATSTVRVDDAAIATASADTAAEHSPGGSVEPGEAAPEIAGEGN